MDILINIASTCFWFALATSGITAAVIGVFFLSAVVYGITKALIGAIGKRRK